MLRSREQRTGEYFELEEHRAQLLHGSNLPTGPVVPAPLLSLSYNPDPLPLHALGFPSPWSSAPNCDLKQSGVENRSGKRVGVALLTQGPGDREGSSGLTLHCLFLQVVLS